uniref:Zinc finger protein n=1 Tax=Solanum tuberosum TaxID=4113 RepID=M1B9T1_SOLTU
MGTPEFPNLGKHCFVEDCRQVDFLPFTRDCRYKVPLSFSLYHLWLFSFFFYALIYSLFVNFVLKSFLVLSFLIWGVIKFQSFWSTGKK